jgi:hypothetical protein
MTSRNNPAGVRNPVVGGRNGSFATEAPLNIDHMGSTTLPDVGKSYQTLNNTPVNRRKNIIYGNKRIRETDFAESSYLSSKAIDPSHLLPPCSLSVRDKADTI